MSYYQEQANQLPTCLSEVVVLLWEAHQSRFACRVIPCNSCKSGWPRLFQSSTMPLLHLDKLKSSRTRLIAMANPIKMDSLQEDSKSERPQLTVICHAWNAGKTEISVRWRFLLPRPTPFPPGPKTTNLFSASALFGYSLATKIKASCAGRSLMWLHVG